MIEMTFKDAEDARYSVNLSTGLMYVTESIVGTLMGIILPIKREEVIK